MRDRAAGLRRRRAGAPTPDPPVARQSAGQPTRGCVRGRRARAASVPAVESTRRLLGASFDLLTRTSDDMRRASFYIGLIVLGTVGPFAVASFGHRGRRDPPHAARDGRRSARGSGRSRVLGCHRRRSGCSSRRSKARRWRRRSSVARLARPADHVRGALARSRMVFWRVVVGVDHRRDPGRRRAGRVERRASSAASARRPTSRS